jgi:hypothetical protein
MYIQNLGSALPMQHVEDLLSTDWSLPCRLGILAVTKQGMYPYILFIYIFVMTACSFEKQIKCLEREQPRAYLPPPLNKCKMQKENVVLPFPVQQIQKAAPSSTMPIPQYCRPLAATGASREGSFVVRTNHHGCARFLLAGLGIGEVSCRSKVAVVVRRIARALLAELIHT